MARKTWENLGVISCDLCHFKSDNEGLFQAHVCRKNKKVSTVTYNKTKDNFSCSLCTFEAKETCFSIHLQHHLITNPFKCNYCKQKFKSKVSLETHVREEHPSSGSMFKLKMSRCTKDILGKAKLDGSAVFYPVYVNSASVSKIPCPSDQRETELAAIFMPTETTKSISKLSRLTQPAYCSATLISPSSHACTSSQQTSDVVNSNAISLAVLTVISSSRSAPCLSSVIPKTINSPRPTTSLQLSTSITSPMVSSISSSSSKYVLVPIFSSQYLSSATSTISPLVSSSSVTVTNVVKSNATSVSSPFLKGLSSVKKPNPLDLPNGVPPQPQPTTCLSAAPAAHRVMDSNHSSPISPDSRFPPIYSAHSSSSNLKSLPSSFISNNQNPQMIAHDPFSSPSFISGPNLSVNYPCATQNVKLSTTPSFSNLTNHSSSFNGIYHANMGHFGTASLSYPPVGALNSISSLPSLNNQHQPINNLHYNNLNSYQHQQFINDNNAKGSIPTTNAALDNYSSCTADAQKPQYFVVNKDFQICKQCRQRFSNYHLFSQHIHTHIRSKISNCCFSGYDWNCPHLQNELAKLKISTNNQTAIVSQSSNLPVFHQMSDHVEETPSLSPSSNGTYIDTFFKSSALGFKDSGRVLLPSPPIKEMCASVRDMIKEGEFRRSSSCELKDESHSSDICSDHVDHSHSDTSATVLLNVDNDVDDFASFMEFHQSVILHYNLFKCCYQTCSFSSHGSIDFMIHLEKDHGGACEFCCIYCGFKGERGSDLIHHLDIHNSHQNEKYSCSITSKAGKPLEAFSDSKLETLINMVENKLEIETYAEYFIQCNSCETRYSSIEFLKTHMKLSALKTYGCRLCRSIFLDSKSFEQHRVETHPGAPKFHRINFNFLCRFRKQYLPSFRQVVKDRLSLHKNTEEKHKILVQQNTFNSIPEPSLTVNFLSEDNDLKLKTAISETHSQSTSGTTVIPQSGFCDCECKKDIKLEVQVVEALNQSEVTETPNYVKPSGVCDCECKIDIELEHVESSNQSKVTNQSKNQSKVTETPANSANDLGDEYATLEIKETGNSSVLSGVCDCECKNDIELEHVESSNPSKVTETPANSANDLGDEYATLEISETGNSSVLLVRRIPLVSVADNKISFNMNTIPSLDSSINLVNEQDCQMNSCVTGHNENIEIVKNRPPSKTDQLSSSLYDSDKERSSVIADNSCVPKQTLQLNTCAMDNLESVIGQSRSAINDLSPSVYDSDHEGNLVIIETPIFSKEPLPSVDDLDTDQDTAGINELSVPSVVMKESIQSSPSVEQISEIVTVLPVIAEISSSFSPSTLSHVRSVSPCSSSPHKENTTFDTKHDSTSSCETLSHDVSRSILSDFDMSPSHTKKSPTFDNSELMCPNSPNHVQGVKRKCEFPEVLPDCAKDTELQKIFEILDGKLVDQTMGTKESSDANIQTLKEFSKNKTNFDNNNYLLSIKDDSRPSAEPTLPTSCWSPTSSAGISRSENPSNEEFEAKLYKCKVCGFQTRFSEDVMAAHLIKSKNHQYVECWYCDKIYCAHKMLANHIRFHHRGFPFRFKQIAFTQMFSPVTSLENVSSELKAATHSAVEKRIKEADDDNAVNNVIETVLDNRKTGTVSGALKKLFRCTRCQLAFTSIFLIKSHFKKEHKADEIKWVDMSTNNVYTLSGRIVKGKCLEPRSRRYLCYLCNYRGNNRQNIHKHLDECHDDISDRRVIKVVKLYGFSKFPDRALVKRNANFDLDEEKEKCNTNIPKAPTRYNCHLCPATLSSLFFFRHHLAQHGGFRNLTAMSIKDGLLICAQCGFIAGSSQELADHVAMHATDRRYKCSLCDFEGHKKKFLESHIKTKHKDKSARIIDREKHSSNMRLEVVNLFPRVLVQKL